MAHEDEYEIGDEKFDDSPPAGYAMLITGVGSVLALFALVPLFHVYFASMVEGERSAAGEARACMDDSDCTGDRTCLTVGDDYRVCETELEAHRRDVRGKLNGGRLPIGRAIENVAGPRQAAVIRPQASDDLGALAGWSQDEHPEAVAAAERAIATKRDARRAARRAAREAQAARARAQAAAALAGEQAP